MKIGIGANINAMLETPMNVAKTGEDLGYESFWLGEHITIPYEMKEAGLYGVKLPAAYKHMMNPWVIFTGAAAVTKRIKIGACIILVPQRHPLDTAKAVASLDQVSNGRFIFGIGAGWIKEEAEIFGYPFEKRWPITMDYMKAIKKVWAEDHTGYDGEYVSFQPVYCYPKPVQKPHPPVLIGAGNPNTKAMPAILRRIADHADGWLPSFFTPAEIKPHMQRLKELCDERGRDFKKIDTTLLVAAYTIGVGEKFEALGEMNIPQRNPHELFAEYEELGVTRIIVGFHELDKKNGLKTLENAAKVLKLS